MSYEMNQIRVEVDAGPDSAPVDITVDVAVDGSIESTNINMGRGERPSMEQLARLLAGAEAIAAGSADPKGPEPEQYHVEVTTFADEFDEGTDEGVEAEGDEVPHEEWAAVYGDLAEEDDIPGTDEDATVVEEEDLGDPVTFEPLGMGQRTTQDAMRYHVVLTEPEEVPPPPTRVQGGVGDDPKVTSRVYVTGGGLGEAVDSGSGKPPYGRLPEKPTYKPLYSS